MKPLDQRFGSIRFRITAIAAVVVAIVLAFVAVVLVSLVQRELYTNLDNSLEQRADTYETSFVEQDDQHLSILLNTNEEDRAAQLVDRSGMVIASTPNLAGAPPLDDALRPAGQTLVRTETPAQLEDDSYRVLTREVNSGGGGAILHVAQNTDDLTDTIRNLGFAFTAAVPLVVAVLAALVWWLVGRTLRPVELIRSEVADISGTDLQRRLPVPDQADEIARLAETMNAMLDRIDQAAQRQRRFVADASHELRTPLTRIRTELEVDVNQPDLADLAATHSVVLDETIAVQDMLDNLLFLARSDEHQHRGHRQPVDLDDIVLREAAHHGIDSEIAIDVSAVSAAHVIGDASQLTRLVRNLLGNAVRHATSTVEISLSETDGRTRLTVTDDGDGVPPETAERIFERFGRAGDARTRHDGGSGLGLAIVRDIARRHGGDVSYDDARTVGARFVVVLETT